MGSIIWGSFQTGLCIGVLVYLYETLKKDKPEITKIYVNKNTKMGDLFSDQIKSNDHKYMPKI